MRRVTDITRDRTTAGSQYVPKGGFVPVFAVIEPTSICNLSCSMCIRAEVVKTIPGYIATLTPERIAEIAAALPGLQEVKFQGLGESFLAPNAAALLRCLKTHRPALRVVMITNALWPRHTPVAEILEYADHVYVSIDGYDKRSFEAARSPGRFHTVLENVKRILLEKPNHTKVSLNCCFTQESYAYLYQTIILARALSIDNVRFNLVQNWLPDDPDRDVLQNKYLRVRAQMLDQVDTSKLADSLDYMHQIAQVLGVEAVVVGNPDFKPELCEWSERMTYITSSGEVLPCAMRCHPKESFGNMFERPFEEIWNSPAMNSFRQDRRSGNLPSICRNCPYALNAQVLKRLEHSVAVELNRDYLVHE